MSKTAVLSAVIVSAVVLACVTPCAWAEPPKVSSAPATAPASAPALTETTRTQSLVEWFVSGGWVMWVLLGFSVIGLGVALERVFMLRRGTTAPRGLIRKAGELWRQGKYDEVYALANQSRSTMGRIIAFLAEKRGASIEEVNIGASDIASSEHRRLMSRFSLLSVITMASPLTGLLGTVGAMIEAFRNVVNAGKLGSAAVLYASISTALVTTEAGLMVAIPALILYHYFKNRTNAYSAIVDEEATVLINEWFIGKGKGPSA